MSEDQSQQTPAAVQPDSVRIYNRSTRQFVHELYPQNPGETKTTFLSLPQTFVTVPSWLADKWMKDYPDDFIGNAEAQKQLGGANAALAEAKQLLADQDAAMKQLQATADALQEELAALKAKRSKG